MRFAGFVKAIENQHSLCLILYQTYKTFYRETGRLFKAMYTVFAAMELSTI